MDAGGIEPPSAVAVVVIPSNSFCRTNQSRLPICLSSVTLDSGGFPVCLFLLVLDSYEGCCIGGDRLCLSHNVVLCVVCSWFGLMVSHHLL